MIESSSTATVMPSTPAVSVWALPSFTSKTSAKSPPTPIRRVTGSGSVLMLRSVISSVRPSLSTRRLATSMVLSARPGRGGIRLKNVHAKGSRACGESGSGTCPLMLSSSLLISLVSLTNRPCDPPCRRSPEDSEMQNVVPSSSVTGPLGAPIVVTGAPSNVQTWPIWRLPGTGCVTWLGRLAEWTGWADWLGGLAGSTGRPLPDSR